ncbi:hypothetical protein [Oceanobacillus sp. FSL H7-0719]|uniref:hypothetical protein n=1 Tax=Oceanobacillus sp. FSL H7-0719 TaxID=2954507 RepID=UPI003247DDB8
MGKYDEILTDILKDLYEQTGRKHDAYYHEDKGALFVSEGYKLHPNNVVYKLSETELRFMNGDIGSFFGNMRF